MYIDPAFVLSMFMLSFVFCGSVWSFWVEILQVFLQWVLYWCIVVENYQEDIFWINIIRFKPAIHFFFPTQVIDSNVMSRGMDFFVFGDLKWEMVAHFADIGGIVTKLRKLQLSQSETKKRNLEITKR